MHAMDYTSGSKDNGWIKKKPLFTRREKGTQLNDLRGIQTGPRPNPPTKRNLAKSERNKRKLYRRARQVEVTTVNKRSSERELRE